MKPAARTMHDRGEPRSRSMTEDREKSNRMLHSNCRCPGCCYMANQGSMYCSEHEAEKRHYPAHEVKHVTQYVSTYPKYPTGVGQPEGRSGKI